jgi:hypothetical protein
MNRPPLTGLVLFPSQTQLLKIGGEVPLVLPPKLGGYWLDPPLDKLVDMSPCTSPQHGLDPACYDILERDSDAKIYREFFGSLVSGHNLHYYITKI